jgi:hypothetical protein
MFGFIRKAFRPMARIGEKMSEIFSIGRKSHLGSDIKNIEAFEDIAPSGLRSRFPKGEVRGPDGAYYADMDAYLKSNPYPT